MREVWFTADLHLGHTNILRHCLRPFLSADEQELALEDPHGRWSVSAESLRRHDDGLLDAIDRVVQVQDTLWILGDFCWGGPEVAREYRKRIRCRSVNLVLGNHDKRSIENCFASTLEQGMIGVGGENLWLNHYPMRSWKKSHHGSWQLYGHVHGRLTAEDESKPWCLTKDVGVDACGYQPISFEMLQAYMAPRVEAFRQRRQRLLAGEQEEEME